MQVRKATRNFTHLFPSRTSAEMERQVTAREPRLKTRTFCFSTNPPRQSHSSLAIASAFRSPVTISFTRCNDMVELSICLPGNSPLP